MKKLGLIFLVPLILTGCMLMMVPSMEFDRRRIAREYPECADLPPGDTVHCRDAIILEKYPECADVPPWKLVHCKCAIVEKEGKAR